jgi:extracellular elastinolytic metalloproteinase
LLSIKHRRSAVAVTAALVAGATALTGVASTAASAPTAKSHRSEARTSGHSEARGYYDARTAGGTAAVARDMKSQAQAARRPATRALSTGVGGALLDLDPSTGTPRLLGKLDGYLTKKSDKSPRRIALTYVEKHAAALGLRAKDFDYFVFRDDYKDIHGTHHLSWKEKVPGIGVLFGYGLQAAVKKNGRLLMIGGSPVPGRLLSRPAAPRSITSANGAISASRRAAGESRTSPGANDSAERIAFFARGHVYSAWQTITMSAAQPALTVQDAASGKVLYRRPLGQSEHTEVVPSRRAGTPATGLAFKGFADETPQSWDFSALGWLSESATTLNGNNAHAYSDVNDDSKPEASEEVGPSEGNSWNYEIQPFDVAGMNYCDNPYPCTWDPNTPYSWQANREQNTTQVFYFVNNWHDVLESSPIGFTEDAGNFQATNASGKGKDNDAVNTNTLDGANTGTGELEGLPDGQHLDNANMDTPPDGHKPLMQMYLQHQPFTDYSTDGDPFPANNTGDESDTVYHEYTHGLSNRLVISPTGESALGPVQAGAMGEAWGDFYATSYLVDQGIRTDGPQADLWLGNEADGLGEPLVRTQPIDCEVGDHSPDCNGGDTGHGGGYTYADYGKIIGQPEVHADGEIWAETLWDLRTALGYNVTMSLVTRAMELSPYDPSMLDERNAVLMADTNVYGGAHHDAIWQVFANRGMGFYAGALGGEDAAPGASFDVPPTDSTTGTITGKVVDSVTHDPVQGVPVTLAFQGADTVANPTAVTNAKGKYSLGPVPTGTYSKLVVNGAGYVPITTDVTVTSTGARQSFTVQRDWAAASGGARIRSYSGPDYTTSGCGPEGAIDLSQASGWGSTTGDNDGTPTNVFVSKHITVKLPRSVDIDHFGVDPSATCGDGGSASTGDYRIQTSTDGSTWTTAATGTFTADQRGQINSVTPTAGGSSVRFVKFTILSNQTPDFATNCPDGAFSGCQYTDLTELEVLGTPAG